MFFKRLFTQSIAQYSYVIGEDKEMVVIDPQPDIDKYLEISRSNGMRIKYILETHRNEDFTVGSRALSDLTGAKVYIAAEEELDYRYGERIVENQEINIGNMKIRAIHTPGHTLGHMAYILYLKNDNPYMVFTGDTIFFGGVGRTDFYGKDKLKEMTGYLYESIFEKILPLGDHVLLFPAHGAGSACGANIEDRDYSTIGYERKYNPDLQYDSKEEFIENVGKMLHKHPYFNDMEEINLKGTKPIDCNINLNIKYTNEIEDSNSTLVDIRNQRAFLSGHIKESIYIEHSGITSFLNWFVPTNEDIIFITDSQEIDYLNNLYLDMRRIGYNGKLSFLANGMNSWNKEARDVKKTRYVLAEELKNEKENVVLLDIREEDEFKENKPIEGSIKIPMQEIKKRFYELPKDETIYIICASGIRSTTVSSFLEQKNIKTSILLGGMEAYKNLD